MAALLAAFTFVGGAAASASADGTGTISGTVYGADAPTTPLSGVSVNLELPGGSYVQFATTGDDGTYSITGLPAAGYILQFQPAFGTPYAAQWWDKKPSQATATVLNLAAGQSATADATLAAVPAGATVSGTVTDGPGTGIAGSQVQLTPTDQDQLGALHPGGFATTDGAGNFSVTGLQADTYTVQFSAPFNSNYTTTWWNGQTAAGSADILTVAADANLTGIDGVLGTGATISGFVDGADNPGVGIGGGQVVAETAAGNQVAYGSVGFDGTYYMRGVPAGSYTLSFSPPFMTNYATTWRQGETSLASADFFTVGAGDALTGYNADLSVGASISGTLTAVGSAPGSLQGGTAYAFSTSGDGSGNTGFVGSDGTYTIPGLAPGSYTIDFQAPYGDSHAQQWWQNASTRSDATPITLTAGQTLTGVDAVLANGGTISGTVHGKSASGSVFAAENAEVSVYTTDGKLYSDDTMTDQTGAFSIANLPAGSYTLDFIPQGDTTDFVPQWWKNKSTQATATSITIHAGQTKADVNVILATSTIKSTTPKIAGTAKVGRTLTAKPGKWGRGTVAFTYQWSRGGAPIAGATGATYVLTNADAASTIAVTVTGSETGYTTQSLTSASTAIVTGGTLSTAVPSITGTTTHGQTLTADAGTWGPGTVALTYKWYRGSSRIVGATASTYTLVGTDVGKTITVKVTGVETGFTTTTVASAPTATVH